MVYIRRCLFDNSSSLSSAQRGTSGAGAAAIPVLLGFDTSVDSSGENLWMAYEATDHSIDLMTSRHLSFAWQSNIATREFGSLLQNSQPGSAIQIVRIDRKIGYYSVSISV